MLKLQKVLKELQSDQIHLVIDDKLIAGAAPIRGSKGSRGSGRG